MKPKAFPGRVIFDHLQKTAGTAVNRWLRTALGTACVTKPQIGDHRELIHQYGGAYSVISGHLAFHGEGLDPRYDYVTCFRDPVDRALSWIFFVLNNHGEQDIIELRRAARSFLESEGEEGAEVIFSNQMARHLCSIEGEIPQNDQDLLERALAVLDQYVLWGLYDRLPEFIEDFAALLEVPAPPRLDSANKTRHRPRVEEVSPRLKARIEALNAVDIALYRYLSERYESMRSRWARPAVFVPKWQRVDAEPPQNFSDPDFSLIGFKHEGGRNVAQDATVTFAACFSVKRPIERMECGLSIRDSLGRLAFATSTSQLRENVVLLSAGTYEARYTVAVDLPQERYTLDLTFTEKSSRGDRLLARFEEFDAFQINIKRDPPCSGYVSLPVRFECLSSEGEIARLVKDGRGALEFEAPPLEVAAGKTWLQRITLRNLSDNDWTSLRFFPIRVSYHWMDAQGKVVVFEGIRTALPVDQIRSGENIEVEMTLQAPDEPGRYRLQVLPVQERHAWFDKLGFTPGVLEIEVGEPSVGLGVDSKHGARS